MARKVSVGNEFKQIFMMVAVIVALSVEMIATPVMAQKMLGGNMTGGNMTGKVSSLESSAFSSNQADDEGRAIFNDGPP